MNLICTSKSIRKPRPFAARYCALAAFLCLALGSVPAGWTAGLDQEEVDGYLQWLHSLEKTVEARQADGLEETNLLFPFDLPGWTTDGERPYRHLAISKALGMMEQEYPGAERRKISSAFLALSTARNYLNLSEYDSALAWFDLAEELDRERNFAIEIKREKLGAALAAGDSLTMNELAVNTLGAADLTGRSDELSLVCRWLLVTRDEESLKLWVQKLDQNPDLLRDRVLFWHAYSLSWLGEYARALDDVGDLLRGGGLSRGLTESQRVWVAAAAPDLLFLTDQNDSARDLYEALSGSNITEMANWGLHQTANLDFLDGRYLRSSEGFQRVCDAKRTGSYQDHACEMARMTRELERIYAEGKPYGTAAYYRQ